MNGFYITPEQYAKAAANGVPARNLEQRYRDYGWSMERAMTEPIRKNKSHGDWPAIAKSNGITYDQYLKRVQIGWSMEAAATTPVMQDTAAHAAHARSKRKPRTDIPDEIRALAERNGIPKSTLVHRISRQKMDPVLAATKPTIARRQV
jgi:hypothetical protein